MATEASQAVPLCTADPGKERNKGSMRMQGKDKTRDGASTSVRKGRVYALNRETQDGVLEERGYPNGVIQFSRSP